MTVSLRTGYDTGYLTEAAGVDYYTGADGEPPGYWQGKGAAALGLAGNVDAEVMRRLYHEDIGPDGQLLRPQRKAKYPVAGRNSMYERIEAEVEAVRAERGRFFTPEEERKLRLQLRSAYRTSVPFYDMTFSAPKSVSVLWASLLAASTEAAGEGREADAERLAAEAEQIRGAVRRANDRMIAVLERGEAYIRTGHHSAHSGEYRDAGGFIVASFPQHDSRDSDPQLHVHNAIANLAQRADEADERWRALHAQPLFRNKGRYSTLAERYLGQELELLGLRTVLRPDGMALEIGGITDEAMGAFSSRSKALRARTRELVMEYEAEHGHAPAKRAMWAIRQQATIETREAKQHGAKAAGAQLAGWAQQAAQSGIGALAAVSGATASYAAEHSPPVLPGAALRARIIRKAVAAVQAGDATWNRARLTFELGQVLPPLPADVDPEEYLNGLVDEAVSGRAEGVNVLQVSPAPDVIDVSRLPFRKDGTSIYRPPGEERFCTAEHRDHEQYLVDIAVLRVPQRVTAEAAAAALAGTQLDYSQREACAGLLSSARLINCLEAPAGTGKTRVMAEFARVWEEQRAGRMIGVTTTTNAARVMAGEAAKAGTRMETCNVAQFLGKIKDSDETRGAMPLYPGDVVLLDEATQVSTEDALRVVQVARQAGAMVVAAFDPEQLGAVDAGGIFPLIAARHGSYRLAEVRRFTSAWEAAASLRLRKGDVSALAEYAGHGRIYSGPQDRVFDDAVSLYINGLLGGEEALLMATSNETATRLAGLVRERLVEMGKVAAAAEVALQDGNQAGRGDLIRARLNTRIDADGQTLANRDVVRLESVTGSGFGKLAAVRRQTGPDQWSNAFFVPLAYLEENAELAYAGNVHVAQGRTVDRGHLVVDSGAVRSQVYVGATRARDKNTLHVVTGPPDPAQPSRAEREAYVAAQIAKRSELRAAGREDLAQQIRLRMPDRPSSLQLAPWEAILAQALQQDDPELTALATIQAAQDFTTHTQHLFQLMSAFWRLDVVPQIDEMVRQRIAPDAYQRYLKDPEREAFLQELRQHEIGGRRIEDVLDSITAAPLTGLRSIAAGLHGRAKKEPAPARGQTTTWAERIPERAPAEFQAGAQMADERQAYLGEQLAARPPRWALNAWGAPPPEAGPLRDDWLRNAAQVESYRELAAITDPEQAIGPVPAAQPELGELFHGAVRALRLADEAALLKAMGQGEVEAIVDAHDQAVAFAPPDVQPQIDQRQAEWEDAQARAHLAGGNRDAEAQAAAEQEASDAAENLARLAVADAARREWTEAHAGQAAKAEAAARELQARGLDARVIPATDAEQAAAEAQERDEPTVARIDPETAAQWRAEQTARVEAGKQARREAAARQTPGTEAEAEPEAEAAGGEDQTAVLEEIRAEIGAISAAVDQMAAQDAEREASRRAEMDQAAIDEPVVHEAQAEPSLEASWQPGDVQGSYETEAAEDAEPEMEL